MEKMAKFKPRPKKKLREERGRKEGDGSVGDCVAGKIWMLAGETNSGDESRNSEMNLE